MVLLWAGSLNIKYMRASNFMLQMIIYGKIQFLEDDNGGLEVNNSTDIHKQNKATVERNILGGKELSSSEKRNMEL